MTGTAADHRSRCAPCSATHNLGSRNRSACWSDTAAATSWHLLPLSIGLRPSFHPISHPWHQIAVVTEVNFELHRELKRPRSRRLANQAASRHRPGLLAFRGSRMHVTGHYAESLLLPRIVRVCQGSI